MRRVQSFRYMSDRDDFEEERPPRRALQDVDVQNAYVVHVSSDSDSDVSSQTRQIFYFSKKLFDFMCDGATEDRIEGAGRKNAADRKGVLIKRAEAATRTEKLRNHVQDKGAEKPSGPEYAAAKRKRAAQKKNTSIQMGRGSRDSQKIARHGDESQSQQQSQFETSQQPEGSQQKEKPRRLWATLSVPSFSTQQGAIVEEHFAQKADRLRNIRLACTDLINEFADKLDDCIELDQHFTLHSPYDDVHGLILSSVITRCTLLKTGNTFVRSVVDKRHHRFVLSCKLSDKLTGRKNERKVRFDTNYFIYICVNIYFHLFKALEQKSKISHFRDQAEEMKNGLEKRENTLWGGTERRGMTKRTCNCKCAMQVTYNMVQKYWHTHITCGVHTDHSNAAIPPPESLPKDVTDVLHQLKRQVGLTIKQQLMYCAANGLTVTDAFIRRINSTTAVDTAFGLSGDAGFLFVLLNLKEEMNFCLEMELKDSENRSHQLLTVSCVSGKFAHVQGGKYNASRNDFTYGGLDSRSEDSELHEFYDFMVRYLIRKPGLRWMIRNCVWATHTDLQFLAAHATVVMTDTTCKTNLRNMHFGYGSGLTTNHDWFKAFSFVLESLQKRDYFWLWSVGSVSIVPEDTRLQLQVLVTDGDPDMADAIEGAFAKGAWGTEAVLRRRCIFHMFHLNFEKDYPMFGSDGGVGKKCRDWLKLAGKKCQTKDALLNAGAKIENWIRSHAVDGNFTDIAREKLLAWVSARLMHTDHWARYAFNHLQCFDIETTSPAEGAHYGLKSDSEVHSHCELSMLLLADLRRTKQLYFEIEREAQQRALEAATNVKTSFEEMLYKKFCFHTCTAMVKEFVKASCNYTVFRPRQSDSSDVVALVYYTATVTADDPAPFNMNFVHPITKVGDRLMCGCAVQVVHGRPCRHILAYNEGLVDENDFAHFHTKCYLAQAYTSSPYLGVVDRRGPTDLPELPEVADTSQDVGDGDGAEQQHRSKKHRASHPYTAFEQECKRFIVKWGNHPAILKRAKALITDYDNSLGDVSDHRMGRPSSKPTYQASRR